MIMTSSQDKKKREEKTSNDGDRNSGSDSEEEDAIRSLVLTIKVQRQESVQLEPQKNAKKELESSSSFPSHLDTRPVKDVLPIDLLVTKRLLISSPFLLSMLSRR